MLPLLPKALLNSQQLALAAAGHLQRRLDFTELQAAVMAASNVYRQAGRRVRAYTGSRGCYALLTKAGE